MRWYLMHNELPGSLFYAFEQIGYITRCHNPLLYFEIPDGKTPTLQDLQPDQKNAFYCDGTPVYGTCLGPCQFCEGSILIHPELLIPEDNMRENIQKYPISFEKVQHRTQWMETRFE